jgi:5-formyltetrahydrofolate cyclo-ligase
MPRDGEDWNRVRAWRKNKRLELIERRMSRKSTERERGSEPILRYLFESIDAVAYPTLGLYWPIRGEIDLRPLARRHVAAGGVVALPVVVRSAAPVEFWRWQPGVPMVRGLWNIPVPKERTPVTPDLLVIPLVGFDRERYRLGYGGGFYDRTLAAATPRPRTIGVAFADAELATIYPQKHDIPMDGIATEAFVLPFNSARASHGHE